MALTLKNDTEEVKTQKKELDLDIETGDIVSKNDFSDLDTQPIKISTNIDYNSPSKKNNSNIFSIIKWVIIAIIAIVAVKFIINLVNPKTTDLTSYINKEADEVAKGLNLTFSQDDDMAAKIHHYSTGTVTVEGDGEVGVVYIDGKYAGLHTDSKSYTMYNVKVGDPEYSAEENMSYNFDDCMCVLNDMAGGNSTAYYYYNESENDCFVLIVNEQSNRVVAMTYFNNYSKITETLESLE
ncbi:MAG: hypothetical protein J6A25_05135 [Lachnospiraceae bacterium]|nr:hypothetical protein [Lachnospiraceae bacterium]